MVARRPTVPVPLSLPPFTVTGPASEPITVKTPLETTYQMAWQSTPEPYREILEKPHAPPRRKRGR